MSTAAIQRFYKELKDVPKGHVFVFGTTASGGGAGQRIAREQYGRTAGTPPTGYHESHLGRSYGIAIRDASMVKMRPIADIVDDFVNLHFKAVLDVKEGGDEITYVLADLFQGHGDNYVRDLMHHVYRVFNKDHLRGKFVYPHTWERSQACKPRNEWK